ncbi:MAG: hypothetical protein WD768_18955 [Phycisphaeraceae bacterium]
MPDDPPPRKPSKRGNYLVIAIIVLGTIAGIVAVVYWKFGVTVRKIEDGNPQSRGEGNTPKAHALLCIGTVDSRTPTV